MGFIGCELVENEASTTGIALGDGVEARLKEEEA